VGIDGRLAAAGRLMRVSSLTIPPPREQILLQMLTSLIVGSIRWGNSSKTADDIPDLVDACRALGVY
jgi:hypothetical protein